MVILDHGSVDEMRRIALDCARELGTIVVSDAEGFAHTQSDRMTRLLHEVQGVFFADFVLFLDADEFVGADDRASLLATLERIPPGGVGYLEWRTFVLGPSETDASDPPRSMRRRRSSERPIYTKAVLRLDGACRPELVVEAGNHDVLTMSGERLDVHYLETPKLLHFPVRSRRQLVTKGVVGWLTLRAADPVAAEAGRGYQWRHAFDRVMSTEGGPQAVDASAASLAYAQEAPSDFAETMEDCPPSSYERRYSTGLFGEPLVLIARSWQRSLEPPVPSGASPAIRFLVETRRPASLLHVGCGTGATLIACKQLGVSSVLGVDQLRGDETVLSDAEYLRWTEGKTLRIGRRFDLVVCIGVDALLDDLVRHAAETIVFADKGAGFTGRFGRLPPIDRHLARSMGGARLVCGRDRQPGGALPSDDGMDATQSRRAATERSAAIRVVGAEPTIRGFGGLLSALAACDARGSSATRGSFPRARPRRG